MFSWLLMQTQSDRVAHGGRRHRGLNTPPRGPACDGLAVGVSAEQVVVLLVVRLVVAVSSPTSHALVAFGQSSPTRRLVTEESERKHASNSRTCNLDASLLEAGVRARILAFYIFLILLY